MLELLILSCSLWRLFYFFLVLFYCSSYWIISIYVSSNLLFFFWPCHTAFGSLVPWPVIRPMPPAMELLSLNHWSAWEILLFIISFPVSSMLLSPCIKFYISNIVFFSSFISIQFFFFKFLFLRKTVLMYSLFVNIFFFMFFCIVKISALKRCQLILASWSPWSPFHWLLIFLDQESESKHYSKWETRHKRYALYDSVYMKF